MDSIGFLEPQNLLSIKSEMVEALKCGDIFVFNEKQYWFCCSVCEKYFQEIENFIKHIDEEHLKLVKDNISLASEKPSPQLEESQITDSDVFIDTKVEVEYVNMDNLLSSPLSSVNDEWEPDFGYPNSESKNNKTKEETVLVAEDKKQKPELACDICCKRYYSKSGLRQHRRKYHLKEPQPEKPKKPKVEKILNCSHCDRTFRYNSERVLHERTHTGEAPFQCPICLRCFSDSRRCKQHQLTHTGERPHKCTHCPSAFTCRSNLLSHIRMHLGDKRFKCDQCGKCFVTTTERIIHIRSHTGEKPYQCEQCGLKWNSPSALMSHKQRVHIKHKKFACQTCGKRFFTGSCLRKHMPAHSDERPFKCSICSATFPRRKSLTSHLKIHSDVKEYTCQICGKEFAQGPGLYSHMKSHGINKTFRKPRQAET